MTPVQRIVLILGGICLALVVGVASANAARVTKHYTCLILAAKNGDSAKVVAEYHKLPHRERRSQRVIDRYEEATKEVKDGVRFDVFPNVDKPDAVALGVFLFGVLCMGFVAAPRKRRVYVKEKETVAPDLPTEGQLTIIRRINGGIVPIGLTRAAASEIINRHLTRVSAASARQRIDISPLEFMSPSKRRREELRVERERKRAQDKLARQQEQERRKEERAAEKAKKAEERLYDRRIAEENRLLKAREERREGVVHKTRSEKAKVIQELQDLVNDILEDKKIEPQEVRQLKAWLLANKQDASDFVKMIRILDESLEDGIIDEKETQAIYEGVIDCLLTIRDRPSS